MTPSDDLGLPTVSGHPDLAYLRAALGRAGHSFRVADLDQAPLSGGRTGAGVQRLAVGESSYVVKILERDRWMDVAIGEPNRGEVKLWLSGATRNLPPPLSCPTIDVAYHPERSEHWMLMEDVASGIRPRGAFDEDDTRALFRAMARLHARYWARDSELERIPLTSVGGVTRVTAEGVLFLGGRTEQSPAWVAQVIDGFVIMREFVPIFLNVLEPGDADFYLELCAGRGRWLALLEQMPATLVHGDLRRANIAFVSDDISLFDWELATRGPVAIDLQWHSFLQNWAYPSQGSPAPSLRPVFVDDYVDHLQRELGERVDRSELDVALDICFLKVLVEIGCCLIDPLTGPHDQDDIGRVKTRCTEALTLARRVYDSHVV